MLHGFMCHGFCITICSLLLLQPQQSTLKALAGNWRVPGAPSSEQFRSPALGPDIEIVVTGETISLAYSFNRHWTLRLDGTEVRKQYRVADGGHFEDVASARVQGNSLILATSRDRGGVTSREERVLTIVGEALVVDGRRWVDEKLLQTSKLTYRRK